MTFTHRWSCLSILGVLGTFSLWNASAQANDAIKDQLSKALTHHVSFDKGLTADFSIDRPKSFRRQAGLASEFELNEDIKIDEASGKFGSALHFVKKSKGMPAYQGDKIVGYNREDWNTSVSLWLKLTPDEDLEPGYCDPIQIVGDDAKNGFIFLEWSKDHSPRYFRFAARPLMDLWDPERLGWEVLAEEKRPMVQLKKAPFSRDKWTHAVFTIQHFNTDAKRSKGTLYLDGVKQGEIKNFDMQFVWPIEMVKVVLGAAYVGHMDDLSIYNRALSEEEVKVLHQLPNGAGDLHK